MKFYQVPLGRRFEFEGEVYVKSKPLTAVNEGNGEERFIRRAADVTLLQQDVPAAPVAAAATTVALEPDAVLAAFEGFYKQCVSCVEEMAGAATMEALESARHRLGEARQRFLDTLALQ